MKTKFLLLLLGPGAVTACQTDEMKYERLNRELLIAGLAVGNDSAAVADQRPVCPDIANLPTNEYLQVCSNRVSQHSTRLALARAAMSDFLGSRSIPELKEAAKVPIPPRTARIPRPCSGPRPYRSWSNTEINLALVRYMGTDNPALPDLIEEAGCRTR